MNPTVYRQIPDNVRAKWKEMAKQSVVKLSDGKKIRIDGRGGGNAKP